MNFNGHDVGAVDQDRRGHREGQDRVLNGPARIEVVGWIGAERSAHVGAVDVNSHGIVILHRQAGGSQTRRIGDGERFPEVGGRHLLDARRSGVNVHNWDQPPRSIFIAITVAKFRGAGGPGGIIVGHSLPGRAEVGAGVQVFPTAGTDGDERFVGGGGSVNQGSGADGTADGAGIRAIRHVINNAAIGGRHHDLRVGVLVAAEGGHDRGVEGGEEAIRPQLIQHDRSSHREVAVQDIILRALPVCLGERRGRGFGITPAGGFGDDGLVHDASKAVDAVEPLRGGQGSIVEHVLLHAVGPADAVFGISHEILVEELGIGILEKCVVIGAIIRQIVEWPGAVFIGIEKGVLEVVYVVFETALGAGAISYPEPVVGVVIAKEGGDRSVQISRPVGEQHVIDQGSVIQKHGIGSRGDAIGGAAHHFEIVDIGGTGEVVLALVPEVLPGIEISISHTRDVAGVLFSLHDIVVILGASVVGFRIGGLRAFLRIVEPPVLSVDVKMEIPQAAILVPHITLGQPGAFLPQEGVVAIASETP